MNLARASEADARRFGSLYFTGLLQTHTNSGRKEANKVPPVDFKITITRPIYYQETIVLLL